MPSPQSFETVESRQSNPFSSGFRTNRALLLLVLLTLPLVGCSLERWVHNGFKVGPDYARPAAPVANEWIDFQNSQIDSGKADLSEWWKVFNDPVLDSLIETAYRQNLTLREAGARIQTAAAFRGITVGNLFPQFQELFGAHDQVKASNQTALFPPTGQGQWFENNAVGLGAAWELDFWGRFRRSIEAANAELDASIENYDDVLVILLSEVASNYVRLRTFQKRLELATRNAVIQRAAWYITSEQARLGAKDEVDASQAKTTLEQTRATIPAFEIGIRLANNRLCVLLGIPVRELKELGVGDYERLLRRTYDQFDKELAAKKFVVPEDLPTVGNRVPPAPSSIPQVVDKTKVVIGIPADLLRRRPDVQRAERQLAAQSARIGIAEADFYPRISLRGNIGVEAEDFEDLFKTPGSTMGNFGPSFNWAILNYGRILNGVRFADAEFQRLAWFYQNSVLQAGQEVEDGIVSYLRFQDVVSRRTDSVAAANRSVTISSAQYQKGKREVTFLSTVVFLTTLTQEQDRLAAATGDVALGLIRLYRALGGGWEMRLKQERQHPPEVLLAPPIPCSRKAEPVPVPGPVVQKDYYSLLHNNQPNPETVGETNSPMTKGIVSEAPGIAPGNGTGELMDAGSGPVVPKGNDSAPLQSVPMLTAPKPLDRIGEFFRER